VTSPVNLPPAEDHLPDETPEALQGIAARLQHALDELFAVRAEATELSKSGKLSDEDERALSDSASMATESTTVDRRLYLPDSQSWEVRIKSGERLYCCVRNEGEDWFHLLVDGELFLQSGEEKLCLNCATRRGILTDDRLFWQTGRRRRTLPIEDSVPSNFDEPLTEGPP
jgi:hypothetical protein